MAYHMITNLPRYNLLAYIVVLPYLLYRTNASCSYHCPTISIVSYDTHRVSYDIDNNVGHVSTKYLARVIVDTCRTKTVVQH